MTMKGLNNFLKSEAFDQAMNEMQKLKTYSVDDYRTIIDSYAYVDRNDDMENEIIQLVNNMLLSHKMGNLSFDEVILLMFRLSSSFIDFV